MTILVSIDRINKNPGALGAEETRQSIPNLAVKLCYGDNTVGEALWKNSLAPGKNVTDKKSFFFLFHRLPLATPWMFPLKPQVAEQPPCCFFFKATTGCRATLCVSIGEETTGANKESGI